jgi:biotin carboxylase
MGSSPRRTILCVSSYFKGNRFLSRCHREGCATYLLTVEALRDAEWDRSSLDDVFLMPSLADRRAVINAVAYLMRSRPIDLIVALDDFDVELVGSLREHFRLPGLGDSGSRLFRDKLAMRVRARELGIEVPEFTGLARHDEVRRFLAQVAPPWLMKPRGAASSIGIHKLHDADAVWKRLEALGDEQSFHLLERFVPGDLYHVDTLIHNRRPVFVQVSQYHRPLLEVYQGGGIFASRTLPHEHSVFAPMSEITGRLLAGFGMQRGCSHTEFIQSDLSGAFTFVETSCRVGGAHIADMVEAATGVNLWEEWAALEIAGEEPYALPPQRTDCGGVIMSLARTEWPDTSGFTDSEIVERVRQKHHIGFVLRAPRRERIEELLTSYLERIGRDFHAVLPPAEQATN